jgi:hypothetical protein
MREPLIKKRVTKIKERTVRPQACVRQEGRPYAVKRVLKFEKESRSEQSVCLSRRMRHFVTSVCSATRRSVR